MRKDCIELLYPDPTIDQGVLEGFVLVHKVPIVIKYMDYSHHQVRARAFTPGPGVGSPMDKTPVLGCTGLCYCAASRGYTDILTRSISPVL